MNNKLKITVLSIIISSFLSSNSFAAIQGYKKKEEDKKEESSSFWIFKGYKTEEQKNQELLEKENKEISVENNIVVKEEELNNNPDLINENLNNEISPENEVVVNIENLSMQQPTDSVNNFEILKPTTVRHVVNSNETLWSLAVKYYNDGNLWTKILTDNPNIKNPNSLHKGQEVIIKEINTNFKEKKYSKLKINPYLLKHILHDVIILNEDHNLGNNQIIASENQQKLIKLTDKFYVPKEGMNLNKVYNVYRFNKNIESLGQEYIQVGEAVVDSYIDELALMKTIKVKDYLLKDDILIEKKIDIKDSFNRINHEENFHKGEILSIVNNKKEASLFDLLIVNLTNKEVQSGSVLNVYSKPLKIIDKESGIESIVPSKEIAQLIIVKAEEDFSLSIVSKSIDTIKVGDTIR